jgi:ATP-dependent protease ClpP protease subunit
MTEKFYDFRMAMDDDAPNSAELLIFGAIGEPDFMDPDAVSAKQFAQDLAALPASVNKLNIHINSPGGSVFDASAIYSRLADHRSTKTVYIDGIAASAATIIAMVGQKIFVRSNATMMVHMPSGVVMGNADDMRQTASALDTVTESMINIYEKRTKLDRAKIKSLLTAETWMSPDDAVSNGFADEVRGVVKAAASLGNGRYKFNDREFDLSRFEHVPVFIATKPKAKSNMKKEATSEIEEEGEIEDAATKKTTEKTEEDGGGKKKTTTTTKEKKDGGEKKTSTKQTESETDEDPVAIERARVAALLKADKPATHELVTAAIADGRTIGDIAAELIEAMDKGGKQKSSHDDRRADASQVDGIPGTDSGGKGEGENEFRSLLTSKTKAYLERRKPARAVHSRN